MPLREQGSYVQLQSARLVSCLQSMQASCRMWTVLTIHLLFPDCRSIIDSGRALRKKPLDQGKIAIVV